MSCYFCLCKSIHLPTHSASNCGFGGWDFLFGHGVSVSNPVKVSSDLMNIFNQVHVNISIHSTPYPWLSLACCGEKAELHPYFCIWYQQACVDEVVDDDVPHIRTMQDVRQEDGITLVKGYSWTWLRWNFSFSFWKILIFRITSSSVNSYLITDINLLYGKINCQILWSAFVPFHSVFNFHFSRFRAITEKLGLAERGMKVSCIGV